MPTTTTPSRPVSLPAMTTKEARAIVRKLYDDRVALMKLHEVLERVDTAEDTLARANSAVILKQKELGDLQTQLLLLTSRVEDEKSKFRAELEQLQGEVNTLREATNRAAADASRAQTDRAESLRGLDAEYATKVSTLEALYAQRAQDLADGIKSLQEQYDLLVRQIRELSSHIPRV